MPADIDVSADISQAVSQLGALYNLTQSQTKAFQELAAANIKLDGSGKPVVQTISSQIDAFTKLSVTLKTAKDGSVNVFGGITKQAQDATKAANDLAAAQAKIKQNVTRTLIGENVNARTTVERQRLGSFGADLGTNAQADLAVIGRRIADLGTQAGLSSRQVQALFQTVASGNLGGIKSQYANVVSAIVQYNNTLQTERNRIADTVLKNGNGGSGGNGLPGVTNEQFNRVKDYAGILTRISGTLTNLALYRGFNVVSNSLSESVKNARDFDQSISLIRTLTQESQLSASQYAEAVARVSSNSGLAAKDIAEVFYEAASAQVASGKGIEEYAGKIATLARVSKASAQDAGTVVAGILNTYGQEAGTVDEISAKLFATIDKGNVKLGQLTSIGRVSSLGKELGVSFDETSAALSTLTRNGLQTDEAMTLLNNVFVKLLKPTEDAKKALGDIGFDGKTLVSAKGFQGALAEINNQIKSGNLNLAQAFNEIRGERGFLGLSQDAQGYLRDLKNIQTTAKEGFKGATVIVDESAGSKINKALNAVQNGLTTGFGQQVNKVIASFIDLNSSAEKFEQVGQRILRIAAAGAAGFIGFRVAIQGLALYQEVANNSAIRSANVLAQQQLAQLRANGATVQAIALERELSVAQAASNKGKGLTSFALANPAALGVTAILAGVTAYAAYKAAAVDTYNAAGDAVAEYVKKVKDEEVAKKLEDSLQTVNKIKDGFTDAAKVAGGQLADAIARNNVQLKQIRENIKASQDALKAGFAGVFEGLRQKSADFNRTISEIPGRIDQARKSAGEFRESLNKILAASNRQYASPQQQPGLIDKEIADRQERVKKLYAIGSKEAIDEANKTLDEIANLTKEKDDAKFELQRAAQKAYLDEQAQFRYVDPSEYNVLKDQTELNKNINDLLRQRNALTDAYIAKLEAQKKAGEAEQRARDADLKDTQLKVKRFEDFNVFNDDGGVKNEFKNSTGGVDIKKATSELQALGDALKAKLGPDILNNLNFDKIFKERLGQLQEELKRVAVGQDLQKTQQDLVDKTTKVKDLTKQAADGMKTYQDNAKGLAEILKQVADSLASVAGSTTNTTRSALQETNGRGLVGRTVNSLFDDIGDIYQSGGQDYDSDARNKRYDREKRLQGLRAQASSIGQQAADAPNKTIVQNGQTIIDPNNIRNILEQLKKVKADIQKEVNDTLADANKRAGGQPLTPETQGKLDKLYTDFNNTEAAITKIQNSLQSALSALDQSDSALTKLKTELGQVNEALSNATRQQENLYKAATGLVGGLGNSIRDSASQLEGYVAKLREAVAQVDKLKVQGAQPDNAEPPRQATGGPIYRAYGGPIGKDNIMAWLQDGEYVMNQASTRQFYSQIVQMNNKGRVPQYFSEGGAVTNMGGVNISVNGAQSPTMTGRELLRALTRAKRLNSI